MRLLDYLYYCFYNWYYRDGNPRGYKMPWFSGAMGFAIGIVLWIYFIIFIYNPQFIDTIFIVIMIVILIAIYILFHSRYIKNNKYEELYIKYSNATNRSTLIEKALVIFIVFFPVLIGSIFISIHIFY